MPKLRLPALFVIALAAAVLAPVAAQQATPAASQASAPAQPSVPAAVSSSSSKKPLQLADITAFRGLGTTTLSPDGQWLAYRLSPLQGDSEVIVRATRGDKEMKFPVGEGAGGAVSFSSDSAWVAITTSPTRREAQANTRARRPNQTAVTITNLSTGEKTTIPKIRRFVFSGETPGWIALHRYGPDAAAGAGAAAAAGRAGGAAPAAGAPAPRDTRPRGTDLIVRDLKQGTELNIGNVSEFAFNKSGRHLALVIDAADQAGNGIQIRDMTTGAITPLETDKAFYERLAWTEDGDALIALKGKDDRQWQERLFSVVGYAGFNAGGAPKRTEYDPSKDTTFPKEMAISGNRAPLWTEARDAFIFGIAALTKVERPAGARGAGAGPATGDDAPPAPGAPPAAADDAAERPNLVLWHYKDPRLQSMQRVQETRDRQFNYVSMYRLDGGKFVRLADEEVPDLVVSGRGRFAIGSSDDAYELMANMTGQTFRDIYAVDTVTGQKKVVKKQLRWGNSASPDGTKYLYYENRHFHIFDIESGETRNVTATVPTVFVNLESDVNVVDPPTTVVGWAADSKSVLISDRWDIWKIPAVAGDTAVNLTVNGKKDAIRYQGRIRIDPEERGIDLTKPQYFSAMSEWTKRAGYGILEPGKTGLNMVLWEDAAIGRLAKAEKGDVWIYSRETPTEATAIYATDATLKGGRKVIDTAAEAAPFAWSAGAQLVEFKNAKDGSRTQASMYLPANYEKGKQYPMIVYIYERLTQGHFQYGRPTANGFSRQAYTSNGYIVLQPDIKYFVNDPGMSAVWAIVPAVQAAIASGAVDPKRVALHGHSWGGYQTSFVITQTDIFAAAIAGAPLTNMISMYSVLYKNTGGTNGAIFESSQGRFTDGPWAQWAAYTRNSPVAHAKNVKTPLIILHNDQDGAVDFTQGIEYFNTLRRLQKPVILLEYPGENHSLARPANQHDYTERVKEFFDHYLKGAAAPAWLQYGVPRLEMQKHIDERLKQRQDADKTPVTPPAAAAGTPVRGGGR